MLGHLRVIEEFGFALAVAVLVDALVVRCVLLPPCSLLLGPITWRLPRRHDVGLPSVEVEGSAVRSS